MGLAVSIKLMSAAWELDIPTSNKMVLLALADCANDDGVCWPGINHLVRKCSVGERTVQRAIKELAAAGHITRQEVPGKGCRYAVHPKDSAAVQVFHYVYKTTNIETGEYYIGARTCYGEPLDDAYVGSGEWVKDQDKSALSKEVISLHGSRSELAEAETEEIRAHIANAECKNKRVSAPANLAPRNLDAPQNGARTPAKSAGKPSRTTNNKKHKHAIPANWWPKEFGKNTKSRRIVDSWSDDELAEQVERFTAHHTKVGSEWECWQSAWSTWVLNSKNFKPRQAPAQQQRGSSLAEIGNEVRQLYGY